LLTFTRKAISAVDRFFKRRSSNAVLLICLVAALLIGALDFRGSPGVLILYLIPVAVSSWYGGKKAGWVISIYCALAWLVQSIYSQTSQAGPAQIIYSQTSHPSLVGPMIDLGARLVTFLFLVMVIGQLRASMALQKELVGFIIHDLRSPISSSITGLYTLQATDSELSELDREMVDLALVSNQRALNLVNSMLDVAKFESGSMTIRPETVDLNAMCEACVEQLALWAQGSKVTIAIDVKTPTGFLDRELTGRVIVNLLSNAIKFSPPGSTIALSAFSSEAGLHFIVADQGPGIPPAFVKSLFEPFTQVEGTKGGTGLGLTFCRLATQAQKGKIWVESQLGQGTHMHFTLPQPSSLNP
jgi:signal transduction histidine kinase